MTNENTGIAVTAYLPRIESRRMGEPPPDWRRAVRAVVGSSWFLGSLIGIVSWKAVSLVPAGGYSASAATALSWATAQGLDYGTEIVYTYGPLGIGMLGLATFGAASAIYLAFSLLVANLGLGIALIWAARRHLPLALAFALATVAAFSIFDRIVAIGFLLSAVALVENTNGPRRLLGVLGPALAAVALLTKLNEGIVIAVMITVALVTVEWRHPRRLLASAGIFAAVFSIAWFATGQSVGNLDDYVWGSVRIVSGYSTGQVAEDPEVGWDRLAAAAMILAAVIATVVTSARLGRPRRAALIVLVAILCFVSFKHGFVRHAPSPYLTGFISAMLLPWLVLPWTVRRRWVPVVAVAAITLLSIPILGPEVIEARWNLPDRATQIRELSTLLDPEKRASVEASGRKAARLAYAPLPPGQLAVLKRGTVDVDASLVTLLWAYGLEWHPVPNFDSFATYVPALDEQNARALQGDHGPTIILRYHSPSQVGMPNSANGAINGRYWPWNSPAATLVMLCRYSRLSTSINYQVLGRASDRCGEPRTLRTVSASYGEPVQVPPQPRRGKGVILAKITGLGPTPLEQVKRLVYRGDTRSITLDDGSSYEFIAANAGAGLIVSIPPALDLPSPFRLAPKSKTITVDEQSALNDGSAELEVEFVLVPLGRASAFGPGDHAGRTPGI
jgi:hypothetical protein